MLKGFILQDKKIGTADVAIDLIPVTNKKARPGIKLTSVKYITVHDTDNERVGADAQNHTKYVDTINDYISWHLTVDEDHIFQELPLNEIAYHVANKDGYRNSIGIEICVNKDGNWKQARQNGILLIAQLMVDLNITIDRVVTHKSWTGKNCPRRILNEGWTQFIKEVTEAHRSLTAPIKEVNKAHDIIRATQGKPEEWIKAVEKIKQLANDPNCDPDLRIFRFIEPFIENIAKK